MLFLVLFDAFDVGHKRLQHSWANESFFCFCFLEFHFLSLKSASFPIPLDFMGFYVSILRLFLLSQKLLAILHGENKMRSFHNRINVDE